MILVHIITQKRAQAIEIIDALLEEKLLFNAMLSRKKVYEKNKETGQLVGNVQTLIIGKTKSLLFSKINEFIVSKYAQEVPSLYCLPIVYIDPGKAEELLKKTMEV